ncbi:MAG: hypothetical protein ACK4P3_03295 [Fimbriimonadaceae bacterium]
MKKTTFALIACAIVVAPLAQAQLFQSGNVVVSRVGDGTNPLINTGNPVSFLEFAPDGSIVNVIEFQTVGADGILNSGTATSEGHLTRTADGRFLVYYAYNAGLPNAVALNSSSGADFPRTVVRVDAFGKADSSTRLTDAQSGNNPRSAASPDGVRFYTAGGNSGIRLAQLGATTAPTQVNTGNVNLRVVEAYNGNLYYSTGSNSPQVRGIYKVQSYPFNAGAITTQVAATDTAGTSSPYGFTFANADTILYVADDRTNVNGGIQRYDLGPSGFTFSYVISMGAGTGARAVTRQGNTLFAITTDNRLVSLEDTGPASAVNDLANGGANYAFRGIAPSPTAPKAAFFNTTSGQVGFWNMQDTTATSNAFASVVPTGWGLVGFGDFTGNKSSDPLFFNSSTNQIAAWFMTGTKITGSMLYTLPVGWSPLFTGDFNGDGNSDIVLTNGLQTAIWLMNGRTVIGSRIYSTGTYMPMLAADLNGLGKDFLVWYNDMNMAVWQMDGLDYVATNVYALGSNRIFSGSGDFDGNNRQDIVVHNPGGDSMEILFMDGVLVDSSTNFTALDGFVPRAFPRFTYSGRNDILLERTSTEDMRIWIMDGSTITDTATVNIAGQVVVGTNDFNRDGRDDVMTGSGSSASFFLMDGTTILQQGTTGFSGTWQPFASPSL